jgi:hypothetical protein
VTHAWRRAGNLPREYQREHLEAMLRKFNPKVTPQYLFMIHMSPLRPGLFITLFSRVIRKFI